MPKPVGLWPTAATAGHDTNGAWREGVRRQALDLRESLRQAGDGALEELLIERLIVSWLAASDAEEQRAGHFREGCSTEVGRFWDGHVACTSASYRGCTFARRQG